MDMDKLSYEIFTILESKFLFGADAVFHGRACRGLNGIPHVLSLHVDQAIAMAFRQRNCASSYVRVQASGVFVRKEGSKLAAAEEILSQRNVESVLFRGKKVSELSNAEKLDGFAEELG
ncbi:patatin-like protein 3 [Asparagus officinalis]|uniref:patatin-like protein 3 n=1 Tax=Asparagus officinalis TaxID=4686 RepID=UPI00098E6AE7|nr:patatin-like protein 3 [Asparagus officinalis]